MNLRPLLFPVLILLSLAPGTLAGPSAIGIRFDKTLAFAEKQSARLADGVLAGNRERFVSYTRPSGIWRTQNSGTWTSGFVPGSFWYLYALTGDETWREAAMHWTEGLRSRATATDNDTGFQIFCSFGNGTLMDASLADEYDAVLRTGAKTLVEERYNPVIGCFRSWDQGISNPDTLPFEVNIDQMMNLELILWVGLNGGPQEYVDYAVSHADRSWENNVRADGGTFHVVAYKADGSVNYTRTHQGWIDGSTWSRGQAWAVYGYTMVYRYTGLPRMLERARLCYDYFMAETLADDDDFIPFSDFDAPLDNKNPRDTSAAAIVASAALELFELTGESRYFQDAEAILASLSSPHYLARGTRYQSILRSSSEKWGEPEVGAIFADYYLLEAIQRWSLAEKEPAIVTGTWAGYEILDQSFVDTRSWMGWLEYRHAPYLYSYTLEGWLYAPPGETLPTGGWFYAFRR